MSTIESQEVTSGDDFGAKNHYGGWLRFFRIINFMWVVFYPIFFVLVVGLIALGVLDTKQDELDFISYLVEFFPPFIFSLLICRAVLVKDLKTPDKIKSLLNLELGLKIVVGFSLFLLFKQGYISEKPTPILIDIIYFLIWVSYFKRSKRVLAFYGANALKKL